MLTSFLAPWSENLNSLRWKPSSNTDDTRLEKQQPANTFDHNPDGSQFLWAPQDTYEGKTFFECVTTPRANESIHLRSRQSVGVFHGT